MKLTKGQKYHVGAVSLCFTNWTGGDSTGYNVDNYFDHEGRYLGPDDHGIEPEFAEPQSSHFLGAIARYKPTGELVTLVEHANVGSGWWCQKSGPIFSADETDLELFATPVRETAAKVVIDQDTAVQLLDALTSITDQFARLHDDRQADPVIERFRAVLTAALKPAP